MAEILKYHVVAGKVLAADAAKLTEAKTLQGAPIAISVKDGKVMINDAEVISADVMAKNGVIHVINKVILPPAEGAMMDKQMDIVDTAVAAGSFKTLAAALEAAGLVETLKGAGPFTVFAPTDEAFAKLPAGTVEALLKDPKALGEILKYHVASRQVHGGRCAEAQLHRSQARCRQFAHQDQRQRRQGLYQWRASHHRRHRNVQRRDSRHRYSDSAAVTSI